MLKSRNKDVVKLSSLLGPGSQCDGDFVSAGSARIDGIVNGSVSVEGTLILGSSGIINGNVEARAVQIAGEVNGNINAPEHAELTSTAKVIGDLATAVIVIDENAVIQGKIDMGNSQNAVENSVKKGYEEKQNVDVDEKDYTDSIIQSYVIADSEEGSSDKL